MGEKSWIFFSLGMSKVYLRPHACALGSLQPPNPQGNCRRQTCHCCLTWHSTWWTSEIAQMHITIMDDHQPTATATSRSGLSRRWSILDWLSTINTGSQGFKPSTWIMPNTIKGGSMSTSRHRRWIPLDVYTYKFTSLPEWCTPRWKAWLRTSDLSHTQTRKGRTDLVTDWHKYFGLCHFFVPTFNVSLTQMVERASP